MPNRRLLCVLGLSVSAPLFADSNPQPQTDETPEVLQATPKQPVSSQTELGVSYDILTNNKGFWRSEYLSFERRYAAQQVVYGTMLQTERFLFNDEQFLLGGYYPISTELTLNMEGNVHGKFVLTS